MQNNNRHYPIYAAILIAVILVLWMLSGLVWTTQANQESSFANQSAGKLPQVRVQNIQASEITREIVVSGRSEPNRRVELRAETEGKVIEILAERGEAVADQALLLKLDIRGRDERLTEAQALVSQRELEYKAIKNLSGQKFSSEIQIAEASSALESAKAALGRIMMDIGYSRITAPFAGVIQDRGVEIGDFVRVGDVVSNLVDLDPVIIVGDVNESEVSHLAVGRTGKAILIDGQELNGTIRYISRVADNATRTFRVELAVPNPDHSIRAGLTAKLSLFADTMRVHTLSSALLSLADDGEIGIKIVDSNNIVRFYPITIVGSDQDGLHVTGLPDSINLITVGQGFVIEGQQVQANTNIAGGE